MQTSQQLTPQHNKEIAALHIMADNLLKQIDTLNYDREFPDDHKATLRNIQSKIQWSKQNLEHKFPEAIKPKKYQNSYNEKIAINEAVTKFMRLNPDQRKYFGFLIDNVLKGEILEIKVAEEEEEIF